MDLQKSTFSPPDNDPRQCDRYAANKKALILLGNATDIKEHSPTPRSKELHRQALELAIGERDFCTKTRLCEITEECRKRINQDLGIYEKSE